MESLFHSYLQKQAIYLRLIASEPAKGLKTIVIIPAFNEPEIVATLESLINTIPTNFPAEVIIMINNGENAGSSILAQNQKSFSEVKSWIETHSTDQLTLHCLHLDNLPVKHAGVGLARKIAMDEAVLRFSLLNESMGVIVSLDADTLVSTNYLVDIEQHFHNNAKSNLATFSFEHPINSELLKAPETEAIILYELYLRYFKHALQTTGFPFAYYTIGSCFAIRASAYVKQGGMNRRKAGEDFYFLHKIFPLGGYSEIKSVFVYPSSRKSDRVPFGTGAAVNKIVTDGFFDTYRPEFFNDLKTLFTKFPHLYRSNEVTLTDIYSQLPASIQSFITLPEFKEQIDGMNNNASTLKSFVNRFYQWFDAFKVIKYLNFVHQDTPKIPILNACKEFTLDCYKIDGSNFTGFQLLELYRRMDRE